VRQPNDARIPTTFLQAGAARVWLAVLCIGIGAGVSAAILTRLLESVQHLVWAGSGTDILEAATRAGAGRHILVLLGAGAVVGIGQLVLVRLTSGNGIDITSAIWFSAGRLPVVRTLGSAALSVIVVGMGASLGREGAPKQAGAIVANLVSDKGRLSDEERRLLVACGAGAGMAAAYGVPLGGVTSSALLLLVLKPAATVLCLRSGAPGGLFTPSLTLGALFGGMLGHAASQLGSGVPPGLSAVLGAGAVLAATTQGPISAVVLMMELTGRDRSFMAPLLLAVSTATLVSRTIEPRSIYDARLSDQEVRARLAAREPSPH
jgi:H+/Cl- antiporter ClcA